MKMKHPRLRDSKRLLTHEPYPINDIPEEVIKKIGKNLVYLLCVGRKDLSGDDWGDVFAEAIGGEHLQSPIGIADVTYQKMAWSMKTVKSTNPHREDSAVRLISGRCSPDYSYGITDPHEDIQRTGRAVLNIWNERVNIAYDYYNPVRTSILVRSNDMLSFSLFEEENHRFITNAFTWCRRSDASRRVPNHGWPARVRAIPPKALENRPNPPLRPAVRLWPFSNEAAAESIRAEGAFPSA